MHSSQAAECFASPLHFAVCHFIQHLNVTSDVSPRYPLRPPLQILPTDGTSRYDGDGQTSLQTVTVGHSGPSALMPAFWVTHKSLRTESSRPVFMGVPVAGVWEHPRPATGETDHKGTAPGGRFVGQSPKRSSFVADSLL